MSVTQAISLTGKASDFLKIGVAAAGRGDLTAVKQLLELRPDWLSRIGSHGRTMLWEAAYRGRTAMVEYLYSHGADIDKRGCHFTPLLVEISPQCAAKHKNRTAVRRLLHEFGARQDAFDHAFLGEFEELKTCVNEDRELLNCEIPQHDDNLQTTILHYAVSGKHLKILRYLLMNGAEPQPHSASLIKYAIWRNDPDSLKYLIEAGAEVARCDIPRGDIRSPEVLHLLDQHGFQSSIDSTHNGWPPLVYHCRGDRGGNMAWIKHLLDQNANVNAVNHKGQTALHCAAKAGFVEIVQLLLTNGANVDAVDKNGESPLATTLRSSIKNKSNLKCVVQLLIDFGANIDLADAQRRTPVMLAKNKRDDIDWLRLLTR